MKIILIVDDDPLIATILSEILEDEGYGVRMAIDGDALSAAREAGPALAVVDLQMPDMDGVEVCHRLRAGAATRAIPIVLMSASGRLFERAAECDADALLAKPFDLGVLLRTVEMLAGPP